MRRYSDSQRRKRSTDSQNRRRTFKRQKRRSSERRKSMTYEIIKSKWRFWRYCGKVQVDIRRGESSK